MIEHDTELYGKETPSDTLHILFTVISCTYHTDIRISVSRPRSSQCENICSDYNGQLYNGRIDVGILKV